MKIKLYIVTYKRDDVLNENLKSLWECTDNPENIEVTILANHPDIAINKENERDNLKVIINTTRMPHAWGYLSRDWNFGILDAFKTWENKDNVDWCVLAQNDVTWIKGWDTWLSNNKDYDFISQPRGDQAMAINIEAVKRIGFFDERFTVIQRHEMDYFIRSVKLLPQRVSINDDHENISISHNEVGCVLINSSFSGDNFEEPILHNPKGFKFSKDFFDDKWKDLGDLSLMAIFEMAQSKCYTREINWYPFFFDGFLEMEATTPPRKYSKGRIVAYEEIYNAHSFLLYFKQKAA